MNPYRNNQISIERPKRTLSGMITRFKRKLIVYIYPALVYLVSNNRELMFNRAIRRSTLMTIKLLEMSHKAKIEKNKIA